MHWVSCLMVVFLRIYQLTLSGLWPGCCRFSPSCSHYAVDALRIHPVWRALPMIAWRLMRCQPFCRGGYDPVPPPGKRWGRSRSWACASEKMNGLKREI